MDTYTFSAWQRLCEQLAPAGMVAGHAAVVPPNAEARARALWASGKGSLRPNPVQLVAAVLAGGDLAATAGDDASAVHERLLVDAAVRTVADLAGLDAIFSIALQASKPARLAGALSPGAAAPPCSCMAARWWRRPWAHGGARRP